MSYKKISVVLTTYNGTNYILELLDSILKQTRQPDEVIIADDCSSDHTVSLIKKYIIDHDLQNWTVYVNPQNLGWQKNFKEVIKRADGEYTFLADQDDIWEPNKIEEYMNCFDQKDAWLIVSDFETIGDAKAQKEAYMPKLNYLIEDEFAKLKFSKYYYLILRPGCVMAFNNNLKKIFLELWEAGTPHDALLWSIAGVLNKIYYINKPLILFRRESHNASNSIAHDLRFKIDEINRTERVDKWYISKYSNNSNIELVKRNLKWCEIRYNLLVRKKALCWLKLFRFRDCYYSNEKYIGDLYYYIKSLKTK